MITTEISAATNAPAATAAARPAVSTLTFVKGPISAVVARMCAANKEAVVVAAGGVSICAGRGRRGGAGATC